MKIFNKILHSNAIYCRKEMVKISKCYLIPKKSYETLSKSAIFLVNPVHSVCYSRSIKSFIQNLSQFQPITLRIFWKVGVKKSDVIRVFEGRL